MILVQICTKTVKPKQEFRGSTTKLYQTLPHIPNNYPTTINQSPWHAPHSRSSSCRHTPGDAMMPNIIHNVHLYQFSPRPCLFSHQRKESQRAHAFTPFTSCFRDPRYAAAVHDGCWSSSLSDRWPRTQHRRACTYRCCVVFTV